MINFSFFECRTACCFVAFQIGLFINSSIYPSFIHSFTQSSIRPFIHSFTHSFVHSPIHPFIHSFIHSFIHPIIHSSIHSFIHPFIHSFVHSPIHPFIYSFTHSFIHSFVLSIVTQLFEGLHSDIYSASKGFLCDHISLSLCCLPLERRL